LAVGRHARLCSAALIIGAAAGLAMPAAAHPHVFVDAQFALRQNPDGGLSDVGVTWRFDAVYTSVILPDFDHDGDGRLSEDEAEELTGVFFEGLGEYNYFTRIALDGTWLDQVSAGDYRVWMEGERLVVGFTVPLPRTAHERIELIPFDDEVFVAYDISIADARAAGEAVDYGCQHQDYDLESWYLGPVSTAGVLCEAAPAS
jgi:ABC-type uncharacterized transport system substrate-binding protein